MELVHATDFFRRSSCKCAFSSCVAVRPLDVRVCWYCGAIFLFGPLTRTQSVRKPVICSADQSVEHVRSHIPSLHGMMPLGCLKRSFGTHVYPKLSKKGSGPNAVNPRRSSNSQ